MAALLQPVLTEYDHEINQPHSHSILSSDLTTRGFPDHCSKLLMIFFYFLQIEMLRCGVGERKICIAVFCSSERGA